MKNKGFNARLVWKQFEDTLVPRLRLSVIDRAVYSHLFRHSRLEGKLRIRFTLAWLARGIRLCAASARESVRRLIELGVLRLVQRTTVGHVVEVRLPEEIRTQPNTSETANGKSGNAKSGNAKSGNGTHPVNWEEANFLQDKALRQAIHARERGRCFYCLRRTNARTQCIDHVVPRALFGRNSYRNLVSCCQDCNARKGARSADNFLCVLYREGRLTSAKLTDRLRALEALAAGKLRPALPAAS